MHTTHALRHVVPGRRRLTVATLVAAFCITLALAIAGAARASAAAGHVDIPPGSDIILPTHFWGPTEVCATNLGNQSARVIVDPFPYDDGTYDTIDVPARETRCISHLTAACRFRTARSGSRRRTACFFRWSSRGLSSCVRSSSRQRARAWA